MVERPRKLRPRPVDALFGDAPSPRYIVEAPRPPTTVSPPPLDLDSGSGQIEAATAAPPPDTSQLQPITLTTAPESRPSPVEPLYSAPIPPEQTSPQEEIANPVLTKEILDLFDEIKAGLSASPIEGMHQLELLRRAAELYQSGDWTSAESYLKIVQARRRAPRTTRRSWQPIFAHLLAWGFGTLVLGISIVALAIISNFSLFNIVVDASFTNLLHAITWGGVGGGLGALWNMYRSLQRGDDRGSALQYFVRPLLGALIGAELHLLSQSALLAFGNEISAVNPDEITVGSIVVYGLVALAGFNQGYAFKFLESLMRRLFRIEESSASSLGADIG